MSHDKRVALHRGASSSSPYPVSRLAPAFDSGELAAEVAKAEAMLSARTGAKLRVIADQIRLLQQEARKVLAEAREEQALTQARCAFRRIPGHTYHLYRKADGAPFFSMLAPEEWGGASPDEFLGSYRLESDYSWTPAQRADQPDDTSELVSQLLRIGGLST
ncbi:MAG: DUF2452 domain-containing protein [Thiocapsa sp.]|jgi:alkylation response protein AidB-like acyl-CoA dehydrogenase|nr:DUF2452 domain-containing protein [Thiocapsa sp.]MCG6896428.1 DUF2452 domain-containing protein [Thiocapsa sp.]MCG6984341.1 DUF2452 domain-containing protein [Thiocapsa sp.]